MSAFFEKLLDLLFPPRCPFCRAILKDHETLLCGRCRKELPWTCGAAQKQSFRHVESCVSPLYYEGDVRRSLLRYKFGGLSVYAPKYAELMCGCIERNGLSFDLISWTPLGRKRLRKRGYDQAKLLAEEVALFFGQTALPLLRKARHTRPQSSLSAEQRWRNAKGAYTCMEGLDLSGKRVLLVDDIVTTGATLDHCALELIKAGAVEIACLTLARASFERKS